MTIQTEKRILPGFTRFPKSNSFDFMTWVERKLGLMAAGIAEPIRFYEYIKTNRYLWINYPSLILRKDEYAFIIDIDRKDPIRIPPKIWSRIYTEKITGNVKDVEIDHPIHIWLVSSKDNFMIKGPLQLLLLLSSNLSFKYATKEEIKALLTDFNYLLQINTEIVSFDQRKNYVVEDDDLQFIEYYLQIPQDRINSLKMALDDHLLGKPFQNCVEQYWEASPKKNSNELELNLIHCAKWIPSHMKAWLDSTFVYFPTQIPNIYQIMEEWEMQLYKFRETLEGFNRIGLCEWYNSFPKSEYPVQENILETYTPYNHMNIESINWVIYKQERLPIAMKQFHVNFQDFYTQTFHRTIDLLDYRGSWLLYYDGVTQEDLWVLCANQYERTIPIQLSDRVFLDFFTDFGTSLRIFTISEVDMVNEYAMSWYQKNLREYLDDVYPDVEIFIFHWLILHTRKYIHLTMNFDDLFQWMGRFVSATNTEAGIDATLNQWLKMDDDKWYERFYSTHEFLEYKELRKAKVRGEDLHPLAEVELAEKFARDHPEEVAKLKIIESKLLENENFDPANDSEMDENEIDPKGEDLPPDYWFLSETNGDEED